MGLVSQGVGGVGVNTYRDDKKTHSKTKLDSGHTIVPSPPCYPSPPLMSGQSPQWGGAGVVK